MTPFHPESPLHKLAVQWYEHVQHATPMLRTVSALMPYVGLWGYHEQPTLFEAADIMKDALSSNPSLRAQVIAATGPHYPTICAYLLLAWSISTHRNRPLDIKESIDQHPSLQELFEHTYDALERIASVMPWLSALAPTMSHPGRDLFFSALADQTDSHLAHQHLLDGHACANVVVAMGHCQLHASPIFPNRGLFDDSWTRTLDRFFTGSVERQNTIAIAVAQSDLPGAYKLQAFGKLTPVFWLLPEVMAQLLPNLPEQEYRRVRYLRWQEASTALPLGMHAVQSIELNQDVVRAYCPTIFPLLQIGCTPEDWCIQERVVEAADRFHMSALRPAPPAYSLPEDFQPL